MRQSHSVTDIASSGREKQRSRTGCRTCRSRKVKCDERPGGCHNCARLNLPCPNSSAYHDALQHGESEGDFLRTQAGLRRSRTYRSCRGCRSSKSRCSGERPTCMRCQQRDIDCIYDGKQAPAWLEAASREADGSNASQLESETSSSTGPRNSPALSQGQMSASFEDQQDLSQPSIEYPSSWLLDPKLPRNKDRLLGLIEAFFANFHSLRLFGFIHKPSYIQQFHDWPHKYQEHQETTLLLCICALGAKFIAPRYYDDSQLMDGAALAAGSQWARRAQQLVFLNLNHATIETTMSTVLLHEHELRVGNYANAFMLTGLGVRMAQALQINIEESSDILCTSGQGSSATTREAKRRLMWSIYIMDSWVGSGVDELTLINEADLKIQLPCSDQSFDLQKPRIVETLHPGTFLPFISPSDHIQDKVESIDLHGNFIRLVSIRRKVLAFVKHLDNAQPPWLSGSEFTRLGTQLRHWFKNLPNCLSVTQNAIRQRKDSSQLGGVFFMHFTYHQTVCDLIRIGMKDLFNNRTQVQYTPQQVSFLKCAQDHCFEHCMALCSLYQEAMRHGPEVLADTWLSVVAHDSAKVIIDYISRGLGNSNERGETLRAHAIAAVHSNIQVLKKMTQWHSLAQPLYSAAIKLLLKEGLPIPPLTNKRALTPVTILENDAPYPDDASTTAPYTPDHTLSSHALFRMVRKDISDREKLSPEASSSVNGSTTPEYQPNHPSGAGNMPQTITGFMPHRVSTQAPPPPHPHPHPHPHHPPPHPLDPTTHSRTISPAASFVSATGPPASSLPPSTMSTGMGITSDGLAGPPLNPHNQLPSSFDDLQTYLPLMNMPAPAIFVDQVASDFGDFDHASLYGNHSLNGFASVSMDDSADPYQNNLGQVMDWIL